MQDDAMFLMGILEMKARSKKITAMLREKAKAGKCIKCDAAAERRGMCFKHYQQFNSKYLRQASNRERAKFFAEEYRAGRVLKPGEVRELKEVG